MQKYKEFGLVNTDKMFRDALRGRYAVPAFNFFNLEGLQAILRAAAKTNSPVILQVSESAFEYMGAEIIAPMVAAAIRQVRVTRHAHARFTRHDWRPVIALHLDHGHSIEFCKRALNAGFSSVMFDGSALPLSENIKQTRTAAALAHKYGASAEGEIGVLAGFEDERTHAPVPPRLRGMSHPACGGGDKASSDTMEKIIPPLPAFGGTPPASGGRHIHRPCDRDSVRAHDRRRQFGCRGRHVARRV